MIDQSSFKFKIVFQFWGSMLANQSDNLSTKSTHCASEEPKPTLLSILTEFNKDQIGGLKLLKQEMALLDNRLSIKDLRTQLEQTKKNLTESCKLKEKLLQKKTDISDHQTAAQLKLTAQIELQKAENISQATVKEAELD